MEKGKRPLVISISGVSGGGKTTIADALNDKLDHSQLLYFDDFEFDGPEDIIQWVDNGSSYDEWDLTPPGQGHTMFTQKIVRLYFTGLPVCL